MEPLVMLYIFVVVLVFLVVFVLGWIIAEIKSQLEMERTVTKGDRDRLAVLADVVEDQMKSMQDLLELINMVDDIKADKKTSSEDKELNSLIIEEVNSRLRGIRSEDTVSNMHTMLFLDKLRGEDDG